MDSRQLKHIAIKTAIWANAAIAVAYLASAYVGYADPRSCGYLSLLGLAYPIFLVAVLAFAGLWAFAGWRRLWISGAALVLTIPQLIAFCPVNLDSAIANGHDFRLMTYNCYGMAADSQTETVANEILRYDADFVCLQETPNVAGMKAHMERSEWDSIAAHYRYIGAGDNTSIGYMSKSPATTLEMHDNGHYFCYAVYHTTLGGLPAYIINAHLESIGLTLHDKQLYMGLTSPRGGEHSIRGVRSQLMTKLRHAFERRAEQAMELRCKADSLQQAHPEAVVMICGDFNDTPYSYAYLTARGDFSDAYASAGLGPVVTYNRNRFYFHIDHILYLDTKVEATACRRGQSAASDHYALVANFNIKN